MPLDKYFLLTNPTFKFKVGFGETEIFLIMAKYFFDSVSKRILRIGLSAQM